MVGGKGMKRRDEARIDRYMKKIMKKERKALKYSISTLVLSKTLCCCYFYRMNSMQKVRRIKRRET